MLERRLFQLTIDGGVGVAVSVAVEAVGELLAAGLPQVRLAGLAQIHVRQHAVLRVEQGVRGTLLTLSLLLLIIVIIIIIISLSSFSSVQVNINVHTK